VSTWQRIRSHDIIERVGHWVHLLNMVLLVLSGIQIHFAGFNLFGSMNTARLVHFVDMYVFLFIGVFHVYQFFATGKWRTAGPTLSNLKSTGGTVKYYLFLTDRKPLFNKYNPLQIITYFLLFALSAVQAAFGFALYWPVRLRVLVNVFGGLMGLRQAHYILAWVFIAFTAAHLYLVLTQPLELTRSMVTGSYWRRANG
jgi:Ni/Fe-hydrogenase 1 B-type cytochrome subunit